MISRVLSAVLIASTVLSQSPILVGGFSGKTACEDIEPFGGPSNALSIALEQISRFIAGTGSNNISVLHQATQIVAGINAVYVFKVTEDESSGFVGITLYINLDQEVKVTKFLATQSLLEINSIFKLNLNEGKNNFKCNDFSGMETVGKVISSVCPAFPVSEPVPIALPNSEEVSSVERTIYPLKVTVVNAETDNSVQTSNDQEVQIVPIRMKLVRSDSSVVDLPDNVTRTIGEDPVTVETTHEESPVLGVSAEAVPATIQDVLNQSNDSSSQEVAQDANTVGNQQISWGPADITHEDSQNFIAPVTLSSTENTVIRLGEDKSTWSPENVEVNSDSNCESSNSNAQADNVPQAPVEVNKATDSDSQLILLIEALLQIQQAQAQGNVPSSSAGTTTKTASQAAPTNRIVGNSLDH